MDTYTVDAEALLTYLVDALPPTADSLFTEAETGSAILELPTIAAAETMYKAEKGVTVRGITVSGDAADVVRGLNSFIPVRVVGGELDQLAAMLSYLQRFPSQIHDVMILASHEERNTQAIITSDEKIADHAPTVW